MVIKASAASEIRQLIAALGGTRRGQARSVDCPAGRYRRTRGWTVFTRRTPAAPDRDTRIAILRALESHGRPPDDCDRTSSHRRRRRRRRGGGEALRGLLDSPHALTSTEALDVLVATVLDPAAERARQACRVRRDAGTCPKASASASLKPCGRSRSATQGARGRCLARRCDGRRHLAGRARGPASGNGRCAARSRADARVRPPHSLRFKR